MARNTSNCEDIHLLLLGKTGTGKSTTGNTLAQTKDFETSDAMSSCTKDVYFVNRKHGNNDLLVVDGPGLKDTDIKEEGKCIQMISDKIGSALTMCAGYVDAILYVISYMSKFTAEDVSAMETIQKIFGPECFNHIIVIVTGGDQYFCNQGSRDFHDWCREQKGEFRDFYSKCKHRFVLMNNAEKDFTKNRQQIDTVIKMAQHLTETHGRYSHELFCKAMIDRKVFIAETKAPHLKIKLQKKMSYLLQTIDGIRSSPPTCSESEVREEIDNLRNEIYIEDNGMNVMGHLIRIIDKLEKYLSHTVKLPELRNELEEIRFKRSEWTALGKKVTIGLALPVATLPFAAVAGAVTGIGSLRLRSQEASVAASLDSQIRNTEKRKAMLQDWTYTYGK